MRDGRFRRLNRRPPGLVSTRRMIANALVIPAVLMILLAGLGYLLNHGHPAALDRGLWGGLLLGLLYGLVFSWTYDRRFALIHLVVGILLLWAFIAWNPVYRLYVALDPHDVRLRLIDQKPD